MLTEHALSADFATRIAAFAAHRAVVAAVHRALPCRPDASPVLRETLKKRHFRNAQISKKRLPKSAHVLFSAPILIARLHAHRV